MPAMVRTRFACKVGVQKRLKRWLWFSETSVYVPLDTSETSSRYLDEVHSHNKKNEHSKSDLDGLIR